MKNNYETINNGITLIHCKRYGITVKVPILTKDLDRAKKFPNTWQLQYSYTSRTHYVYGKMKVKGKTVKVYLHVWLMNPDSDQVVDHVNHIGTDNRMNNLKVCSRSENGQNVISEVIFDQGLGLDGLIWHNSRYNSEMYWMSVYFKDIYLGRYTDPAEAMFIQTIALDVYDGATDEQMLNRIVRLGHKAEDVQRRIKFVRKTFKMPDPSKSLITQKQ